MGHRRAVIVRRAVAFALIAVGGASCRLGKVDVPDLAGPSGFGLSVQLTASPDLLPRDGQSASTIVITARDEKSQPKPNLGLRLELSVNGVPGDLGTLSARTVYTDAAGRAAVVYTAPRAANFGLPDGATIMVFATQIGTDAGNSTASAVTISLVPQGTIILPDGAPVPRFFFTPTQPKDDDTVHFDASASSDPDGIIVSYDWSFGDGERASAHNAMADHHYAVPGTYLVTLTVTDDRGGSVTSDAQTVAVAASGPTASFVFSPTSPIPGQAIFFDATSSRAQQGRTISSYQWSFGDGTSGTGVTPPPHAYATASTFTVTLTVTDSSGRTATTSQTVSVGAPNTVAAFVFSPTDPQPGQLIYFDATSSTAEQGRTISSYQWNFGDGTSATGAIPPAHSYASENVFTVTLTVTDSSGGTATTSKTVAVKVK